MFRKYNNERVYQHPNFLIRYLEKKRVATLLRLANIKKDSITLEVGCVEGHILGLVKKGTVHGIDISTIAIKQAKERLRHQNNIKKISVGDAEHINYEDNTFNRILCSEVLEHVEHPERVIAEIARVAKPKARISISFPNEGMINFCKGTVEKLGGRFYDWFLPGVPHHMEDEWHLHEFSKAYFKQKVKESKAPLTIIKIKAIPFWFAPLRYVALCKKKE